MKKLMLLVALMALVLVAAASAAIAQPAPEAEAKKEGKAEAIVDPDVFGKAEKGKAEAKAGDVVAKSEAPKKEEKKEEKKIEKKEEKKELPKSGGTGSASLLALGAGALLIGGGLLARRIIR